MGVGIHRSKIALYIYDKTFEDNDEDKIVDTDFIERNMGFYEMLDEWKNLIKHDVVSEMVEPLSDELESFADCTDTTMSVYRVDKVYHTFTKLQVFSIQHSQIRCVQSIIYFFFMPILSGLIEISVYSFGELQKAGSERKIDLKKLVIILAIAIMLFAILKQRTKQPATVAVGASQNAATGSPKELPETHTEQVEQITEATGKPISTESEVATKAEPARQETPSKECTEETKGAEPEGTVECIDKGDQALAEYKPQPSGQPNPFENAPPTEIVDQPVEDLIGEGKDRPGEGKHF